MLIGLKSFSNSKGLFFTTTTTAAITKTTITKTNLFVLIMRTIKVFFQIFTETAMETCCCFSSFKNGANTTENKVTLTKFIEC